MLFTLDYFLRADHHLAASRVIAIPRFDYSSFYLLRRIPALSNDLNSFDQTLTASKILLPAAQSSHVLRHTFASRFIMNGGKILTLQRFLGHQSLAMTMRYAHPAPDHLQAAVGFGPVKDFRPLPGLKSKSPRNSTNFRGLGI
ncbi:tyrosine-type recombinase/integrase [Pseudomonas kuykendallii]|uniref:Tyr recombinase domain-containing protein n=1 Tax=Pseudomonas kuykendallii TaxID=1007099 RepID=A0A2W5DBX1_9PSED|nr:MAG: hypothetical protein DI599_04130 [Pseudomonas kuykendallii]